MSLTDVPVSTASSQATTRATQVLIHPTTDNSKPRIKQVKRSRHYSLGVSYQTDDDECAADDTVKQKKTRARKKAKDSSCDRVDNKSSGTSGKTAKTSVTTSTQTDITDDCLNSTSTVSLDGNTVPNTITNFMASISADVARLHSDLQGVIATLLVQHDDLRGVAQKTQIHDCEFAKLNSTVTSLITSLSNQQFNNHKSTTEQHNVQLSRPPIIPYSDVNDELTDSDFPPLPPPAQSMTSITAKSVQSTRSRNATNYNGKPTNDHIKEDVMTAMYVDLEDKQRRATNIIVSGLQPEVSLSDSASVCRMLSDEFDWVETELLCTIKSCRRIGKFQLDKIQPLLIIFNSSEIAAQFIANAKLLRQSRDPVIREKIFISADLTPSEARAAYELRQRRRDRRQELAAGSDNQATVSMASRTFFKSSNTNRKSSMAAALPVSSTDVNFVPNIIPSPLPTTPRLVYRPQTSNGETHDREHHQHQQQKQQQQEPSQATPMSDQTDVVITDQLHTSQ